MEKDINTIPSVQKAYLADFLLQQKSLSKNHAQQLLFHKMKDYFTFIATLDEEHKKESQLGGDFQQLINIRINKTKTIIDFLQKHLPQNEQQNEQAKLNTASAAISKNAQILDDISEQQKLITQQEYRAALIEKRYSYRKMMNNRLSRLTTNINNLQLDIQRGENENLNKKRESAIDKYQVEQKEVQGKIMRCTNEINALESITLTEEQRNKKKDAIINANVAVYNEVSGIINSLSREYYNVIYLPYETGSSHYREKGNLSNLMGEKFIKDNGLLFANIMDVLERKIPTNEVVLPKIKKDLLEIATRANRGSKSADLKEEQKNVIHEEEIKAPTENNPYNTKIIDKGDLSMTKPQEIISKKSSLSQMPFDQKESSPDNQEEDINVRLRTMAKFAAYRYSNTASLRDPLNQQAIKELAIAVMNDKKVDNKDWNRYFDIFDKHLATEVAKAAKRRQPAAQVINNIRNLQKSHLANLTSQQEPLRDNSEKQSMANQKPIDQKPIDKRLDDTYSLQKSHLADFLLQQESLRNQPEKQLLLYRIKDYFDFMAQLQKKEQEELKLDKDSQQLINSQIEKATMIVNFLQKHLPKSEQAKLNKAAEAISSNTKILDDIKKQSIIASGRLNANATEIMKLAEENTVSLQAKNALEAELQGLIKQKKPPLAAINKKRNELTMLDTIFQKNITKIRELEQEEPVIKEKIKNLTNKSTDIGQYILGIVDRLSHIMHLPSQTNDSNASQKRDILYIIGDELLQGHENLLNQVIAMIQKETYISRSNLLTAGFEESDSIMNINGAELEAIIAKGYDEYLLDQFMLQSKEQQEINNISDLRNVFLKKTISEPLRDEINKASEIKHQKYGQKLSQIKQEINGARALNRSFKDQSFRESLLPSSKNITEEKIKTSEENALYSSRVLDEKNLSMIDPQQATSKNANLSQMILSKKKSNVNIQIPDNKGQRLNYIINQYNNKRDIAETEAIREQYLKYITPKNKINDPIPTTLREQDKAAYLAKFNSLSTQNKETNEEQKVNLNSYHKIKKPKSVFSKQ